MYDFGIDSEGHVMEGYLFTDLQFGDRVNVNLGEGETPTENGRDVKYIRLTIRKSKSNVVSLESIGRFPPSIFEQNIILIKL